MAGKTGEFSSTPYTLVGERVELNKIGLLPRALEKQHKNRGREKTESERENAIIFFMGKDVKLSC